MKKKLTQAHQPAFRRDRKFGCCYVDTAGAPVFVFTSWNPPKHRAGTIVNARRCKGTAADTALYAWIRERPRKDINFTVVAESLTLDQEHGWKRDFKMNLSALGFVLLNSNVAKTPEPPTPDDVDIDVGDVDAELQDGGFDDEQVASDSADFDIKVQKEIG